MYMQLSASSSAIKSRATLRYEAGLSIRTGKIWQHHWIVQQQGQVDETID